MISRNPPSKCQTDILPWRSDYWWFYQSLERIIIITDWTPLWSISTYEAKKWPKILVTAVGSWKGPKAPFKNSQAKKNYIYSCNKETGIFGHFWSFLVIFGQKKNYFFCQKCLPAKVLLRISKKQNVNILKIEKMTGKEDGFFIMLLHHKVAKRAQDAWRWRGSRRRLSSLSLSFFI